MSTPPLPDSEIIAAVNAVNEQLALGKRSVGQSGHGPGAIECAAKAMGINHQQIRNRLENAKTRLGLEPNWTATPLRGSQNPARAAITPPNIPNKFPDRRDLIAHMKSRFETRWEHKKAKNWMPFKIKIDGPVGIAWVGDPHVDDDGCNWPLLDRDLKIMRDTKGIFAVNIGDTTNNWAGRLIRLYAEQDTSKETALELVKYLLIDSKAPWFLWLAGNHDLWGDGATILKEIGGHYVQMEDWQAKFRLVFPNKREARVWAAHDFKGNSMWNTLHAPQRAAHTKEDAHIYACGHTHNWALHQEESASRGFTYWLLRARGYKYLDSYAEKLQHFSQDDGATILSVIDPDAKTESGFIQCFADLEEGAQYLTWKRRRHA